MKTREIEYLIENAEQGSGEVETGKAARKELDAIREQLTEAQAALEPFMAWGSGNTNVLADSQGRCVVRVSEAEYKRAAAYLAKYSK